MPGKAIQKYILHLQQKKFREKEGIFVVEGKKIIEEIIHSNIEVKKIYASEEFLHKHKQSLLSKSIYNEAISREDLKKISSLTEPDDALALCHFQKTKFSVPESLENLIVYLDDIRDPGNFGTIIRVCDWFKIPMIICSKGTVDLYNQKVIQSSMGSFIRVPIFTMELIDAIEILQKNFGENYPIYGSYVNGNNVYAKKIFSPGMLIIGNESNGISKINEHLVRERISIPKTGINGPESLNAAIACSLFLGEFSRRKIN
ncbi:MAG: TrmH family RNA methyltransferase [Bacteroidota bacterium]|jgi:TrmH family RNA methyltransferase